MLPKNQSQDQGDLFRSRLEQIINQDHPLIKLARSMDWEGFNRELGALYCPDNGAPGLPTRLMAGMHYLKYAFDESDESVVERWIENPYWQYFCGFEYFQHEFPLHPTSLVKWRQRVGESGVEKLLSETLETAKRIKALKSEDATIVINDTTVQEKAVAFPTDSKLYHTMREKLVEAAETRGVQLRQTYRRKSKEALYRQSQARRSRKPEHARRWTRKLKTWLGRVMRDIRRKIESPDGKLNHLLTLANRLMSQTRESKDKLYSIHAPEVECIAKGKAHKQYEFGCKTSVVSALKNNWILGVKSFHGNPYDGDTLSPAIEQAQRLSGLRITDVYTDKGYRGRRRTIPNQTQHISGERSIKTMTRAELKRFKRRNAIEPIAGHLKSDNRLDRNYLHGEEGDKINAILAGCGYNIRKLLRAFFLSLVFRVIQTLNFLLGACSFLPWNNFIPRHA